MTRPKWFLALAGGLIGSAVVVSAPPPHHPAPGRPAGAMPRPVMHPGPAPAIGHPQANFPGGHLGALSPQSQAFKPSLNPVGAGNAGIRPLTTGPRPLLTNPHPNATAARTWAGGSLGHSQYVNDLAAVSGKSPEQVRLFLASQNHGYGRGYWGGGWGYGGWGWGGGGWGYPGWGFYGFNPFGFGPWGYGSGIGIGLGYRSGPWAFGIGYNLGYSPVMPYVPVYALPEAPAVVGDANPPLVPQADPVLPAPAVADKPAATDFAQQGQELFLAGKYADAVKALRHAVVDDPRNGPLLALTGEALWANRNYNEAAGALQQSLLATPETDWPEVASRAARLIPAEAVGNLGKAIGENETPDLRFLAAYQSFGAGKYDEAAAHLDLLLKKAPDDAVAKKLREQAGKLAAGK